VSRRRTKSRQRAPLRIATALLALGLAGCAAIPWPQGARAPHGEPGVEGWLDLRGVVHVHTRGSHDSPGTISDVVAAARSAGLAWLAITEHTKPGVLGEHGVIGGVTVLPGFEASMAGGSLLALGITEKPPSTRDPAALVRFVREAGGVAVVGHFERSRLAEPEAFRAAAPDAVELVNLHANAEQARGSLAWRAPLLPSTAALGTLLRLRESNLARWERLPGPPPIVGAVDAHAKFRLLGPFGGTVDRYRDVFRLLTTHVLARDASAPAILDALRAGRSYVAFEGLAAVDTFRFEPAAGGFLLAAPREARLALVCDGARAAEAEAKSAVLAPPAGARRCRAEAFLGARPWILTSYRDVMPMTTP
jgi:hypothetical protein